MEVDSISAPDVPTVVADKVDVPPPNVDIATLREFLRKNNFKDTEAVLLREISNNLGSTTAVSHQQAYLNSDKQLDSYKSVEDPDSLNWNYSKFIEFIDTTIDSYKHELSVLLFPVFTHMYLNLVYSNLEEKAVEFFEKFRSHQEDFYAEYLDKLKIVKKREHMDKDLIIGTFRSNKFVAKMARETYMHMKRHMQENKMLSLLAIVQEQLIIETYDGAPRTRQQTLVSIGGMTGEIKKDVNKAKVFYGLLKEPDINLPVEEEAETEDGDKSKKKNRKKDTLALKKAKNDPNAPNLHRIPLPELQDSDKLERINIYKDSLKRAQLGPDSSPSICFYTFLNCYNGVCCAAFTDDSSMLAGGFEDSRIIVWSLLAKKLMAMKSGDALSNIDKDSDKLFELMMDETTASDSKVLVGHSGPVYSVSFSPDRYYLLSGSEDGTVRLWSLMTWTNIVCYKGHNYPVFDVQFGPYGYYFVSGGHDRLARLWSTDHHQPLRLFAGHLSDVDCVKFHHNSNYVATGASDRCVRLFDLLNGNCVRTMAGHKGMILCLAFSPCGRYLVSGGADHNIHIWDLSNGTLVSLLSEHTEPVISLAFSREGAVLASGGLDNLICIWDMSLLNEERPIPDNNLQQLQELLKLPLLSSFPTKATHPISLQFTRRNLLLGAGSFKSYKAEQNNSS